MVALSRIRIANNIRLFSEKNIGLSDNDDLLFDPPIVTNVVYKNLSI